ncbi:hypothetical protein D3C78_1090430 [compost metagenome]
MVGGNGLDSHGRIDAVAGDNLVQLAPLDQRPQAIEKGCRPVAVGLPLLIKVRHDPRHLKAVRILDDVVGSSRPGLNREARRGSREGVKLPGLYIYLWTITDDLQVFPAE